jgi:spore coat protein U-like protein
MRNLKLTAVATGALLALAGAAQAAGPKTTTFAVSATVAANCLVTAGDIDFGDYEGVADKDDTSTVGVRCTNGTAYTVELNAGIGAGATFATRYMSQGADKLAYSLYTDGAHANVWGDGTGGSATNGGTGTGMSLAKIANYTVHGLLPNSVANQDAPVGAYADTVTVTVEY